MNIFDIIARGSQHAATRELRLQAEREARATEATRAQWLNALLVDDTRAWMEIGEANTGVIEGMATMLAIAGFVHVFDARSADTPDLRVLRGAISAATQAAAAGGVVSVDDARAFSSAAQRARAIIADGTPAAIRHAALSIRETVGLPPA